MISADIGATPEVKTETIKDCPGSGNGQTYMHKWIWASTLNNEVSFKMECLRCGQFKDAKK